MFLRLMKLGVNAKSLSVGIDFEARVHVDGDPSGVTGMSPSTLNTDSL